MQMLYKKIAEICPEKIVYVSCNPATQARDLALLKDQYTIATVQPVDMFPHTHHVEKRRFIDLKQVMKEAQQYWNNRYLEGNTPWDIGYPSTPLKEYADQLTTKDSRILIPGSGTGQEALYLMNNGFTNVYVIDISASAVKSLKKTIPAAYQDHIILGDFFEHKGTYDSYTGTNIFLCAEPIIPICLRKKDG